MCILQAPSKEIQFHKVNRLETGLARYTDDAEPFTLALEKQPDGTSEFCFSITIRNKNPVLPAFVRYFYEMRLILHESEYEFGFLNDSKNIFKYILGDQGQCDFESMYAYISEVLEKTLQRKPWERYERASIGFALSTG